MSSKRITKPKASRGAVTRVVAIVAALGGLLCPTARAVLIDSGDGSENTAAPTPDPGFANVGVGNGLTVVYLGDGWVLSAAHVGEIRVAIDGGVYPPVAGSRVALHHDASREADIEVFRIDPYPRHLPRMPIREVAVHTNEAVLMFGHGRNRGPATAWEHPPSPDGYQWGPGNRLRWGTNRVSRAEIDVSGFGHTTRSFYTSFSQGGTAAEAQATQGDSGGPVFTRDATGWMLAGIMYGTSKWPGQPAQTSIYGNFTYVADLSYYRQQIVDIMTPRCGNGHLTVDEACDDGNTVDGDCCSSRCRLETAGTACDDGLYCNGADACDGRGTCTPRGADPCDDRDDCSEDHCDEDTDRCSHAFAPESACELPVPTDAAAGGRTPEPR